MNTGQATGTTVMLLAILISTRVEALLTTDSEEAIWMSLVIALFFIGAVGIVGSSSEWYKRKLRNHLYGPEAEEVVMVKDKHGYVDTSIAGYNPLKAVKPRLSSEDGDIYYDQGYTQSFDLRGQEERSKDARDERASPSVSDVYRTTTGDSSERTRQGSLDNLRTDRRA